MSSIKELLGETGSKAIEAMLAEASRPAAGILATILGIGALIFAAIVIERRAQHSLGGGRLNGFRNLALRAQLRAVFAAVLTLGFLLPVSLLASAGLAAAGKYAGTYITWRETVASRSRSHR